MAEQPPNPPDPSPEINQLNLDVAERVRQLPATDLVNLLSGRVSSLLNSDDNQNQNQGAR
jgi:hypothetical protein